MTKVILRWMDADRAVLLPAFSSVLVAFTALGLSVYAIAELSPKPQSATIAFDSAFIPPAVVNSDRGDVTFFVSFLEEGGAVSLTDRQHKSVTLRPSDEDFLGRLSAGLQKCIDKGRSRVPTVSVRGFASGSFWGLAASELSVMLRERPNDSFVREAYAEIGRYARNDAIYKQNASLAVARAFNVYLANRRRDAVLSALSTEGGGLNVLDEGQWSMRTVVALLVRLSV